MNILFVCNSCIHRAPGFEKLFQEETNNRHFTNASGTHAYHKRDLLNGHVLRWADVVFVMTLEEYYHIYKHFHKYVNKVIVVGVPDNDWESLSFELVSTAMIYIKNVVESIEKYQEVEHVNPE